MRADFVSHTVDLSPEKMLQHKKSLLKRELSLCYPNPRKIRRLFREMKVEKHRHSSQPTKVEAVQSIQRQSESTSARATESIFVESPRSAVYVVKKKNQTGQQTRQNVNGTVFMDQGLITQDSRILIEKVDAVHKQLGLTSSRANHSTFDSVFVESLSCPAVKTTSKSAAKRKNRTGQRARKKQWETIYGLKANHLRKTKQKVNLQSKKQVKKVQEATETLHPSWEASRKKKELETKITSFQGQRIVFSDSD